MDSPLAATLAQSHRDLSAECAGCLITIFPLQIDAGIIQIDGDRFTIGRDAACDLQVHDNSVSRNHATIEKRGATYFVTDDGSTNGIFVNDRQTTECELRAGDRLRCGTHIFKFLDQLEAQYHETVYDMMTRDGLTGVFNKRYFMEVLNRDINRCQRRDRSLSLILIDIDHFKGINDQYGHLAGDEVLQELCRRIQEVNRQEEVFARFGGEEFALIITDGDLNEAEMMAERSRAEIERRPFETSAGSVPVTISVGLTIYRPPESTSRLLERADQHLYEAKRTGRNRVCSSRDPVRG